MWYEGNSDIRVKDRRKFIYSCEDYERLNKENSILNGF